MAPTTTFNLASNKICLQARTRLGSKEDFYTHVVSKRVKGGGISMEASADRWGGAT